MEEVLAEVQSEPHLKLPTNISGDEALREHIRDIREFGSINGPDGTTILLGQGALSSANTSIAEVLLPITSSEVRETIPPESAMVEDSSITPKASKATEVQEPDYSSEIKESVLSEQSSTEDSDKTPIALEKSDETNKNH